MTFVLLRIETVCTCFEVLISKYDCILLDSDPRN